MLLFVQLHIMTLGNAVVKTTHHVFSQKKQDMVWDTVEKKLHTQKENYQLHFSSQIVPQAHATGAYDNAPSYIAVDFDNGNVLEEKHANDAYYIASLTKIMTAMVALDLMDPDEQITISRTAPLVSPTKIGVTTGERMSLSDLMQAMLMYSANDAAQAIHDGVNEKYGQDIFIQAMNEKARLLGLTHTHFANPQGFDDIKNYSSAADLAVLSHYALTHYPLIAQIVNQQYTVEPGSSSHKEYDLPNWNGLLGVYPGVNGVKIGNTGDAGYTMVVTSQRNGHTVTAIMLGTPGILQRDEWTASLLDSAFASAYDLPPVNVTPSQLRAKYASWYQR